MALEAERLGFDSVRSAEAYGGYEEAAATIQDLYLDGRKGEAAAPVPDELVDDVALVGPRDRIRDQLALWGEAGVDTIIVGTSGPEPLRALAEAAS
jgi:alkanesulfonate monooxygenase SsuD/methylene tetrahydromethanopterin reductase-like flavin-dependent oxidoreductase (luciferase family)